MDTFFDVIIVGGGLAGLTAAIHLSQAGKKVLLIEKNSYPRHKVCGEYISNEVLQYFKFLSVDVSHLKPTQITKTSISAVSGKKIQCDLPVGGFGLSRFALDNFLYQTAKRNGCSIIHHSVDDITFEHDAFTVLAEGNKFQSPFVLGAFGKRSNIDQKLMRNFVHKKSPWLAVKAHYSGEFPDDRVDLHNFNGGYCGVSKVEGDHVNICYLADYKTFKKYRNISEYEENVVCENPNLKEVLSKMTSVFEKPLTISQISFEEKNPVEKHILMIGDTAGLIHPLCGNGMAMAINSARICSELLFEFFEGKITTRENLEKKYALEWKRNFGKRMKAGKLLAMVMQNQYAARVGMKLLVTFPSLLPWIIKQTHGEVLYE